MALTKVSYSMIQGATFNAADYGLDAAASAATNVAALQNAVAAINAAGGGLLLIPPGTYDVVTTPVVSPIQPDALFAFDSCTGVGVQSLGATINDTTNYDAIYKWSSLFSFENCVNVAFDLNVTTQAWIQDPNYDKRGLNVVTLLGQCINVTGKVRSDGGIAVFRCYHSAHDGSEQSRIIDVQIDAKSAEYPMLCEDSGSNLNAQIFAEECGRTFFISGTKNVNIDARVLNCRGTALIAAYGGYGCSDVNVRYVDRDSTVGYATPAIRMQYTQNVAARMRNINIVFDVYNAVQSPAYNRLFDLYTEFGGIGHILDGLDITGIMECGADAAYSITNAVSVVGGQAWTSSDFMRRINFHDIFSSGTGGAGAIDFALAALKDTATVTDVVTVPTAGIFMRNGAAGQVIYTNCRAANFTDSTANTDGHVYINTKESAPQSQINKLFVNADLNGMTVNVLNGLIKTITDLASGSAVSLSLPNTDDVNAIIYVLGDGGVNAIYLLQGGNHATFEMSDPLNKFSTSAGTATSTNIYWSAGNSRYELQNNTGGTQSYQIQYMFRTF